MGGAAANRRILMLPGRLAGPQVKMSLGGVSRRSRTNAKALRWEGTRYTSGEEEGGDVGQGASGEDPDHSGVDFRAGGRTDMTRSLF